MFRNEEHYYILLFIILDLKYIINYDKINSNYLNMIVDYSKDENYNNMKYEINNDSLIINNNIKINNKYRIETIMKDLNWLNDIDLNKFVFIPYIKIEYLIKFNKRISKSKTISTLLNYIYPGYEEIKLFESEFIENLFNDVIILFFSFFY